MTIWTNWARTVAVQPARVVSPRSTDHLVAEMMSASSAGLPIKAVGAGHSFTAVAEAPGLQVRLDNLTGIEQLDHHTGLVRVLGGTTLHDLGDALWNAGLSMTNLGDIDAQSITGAISTGTHGTGTAYGGIATQVRELDLVLADGTAVTCSPKDDPDLFTAAQVGLGALGIITAVTLQCEPRFALEAVEAPADFDEVLADLDQTVAANDYFEFYWFPHTRRTLTKTNNRRSADGEMAPIGRFRGWVDDELLSNKLYEQVNRLAAVRPSLIPRINSISARALSARRFTDRSYRVFSTSRDVVFREMEYAVPRAAVHEVLREIDGWLTDSGELIAFPIEVRFAAADDIWLSTAYGRDTAYIAVHQYARRDHRAYFRAVEAIARVHGGRPHWGKLHGQNASSLRHSYPRFDDFLAVRDRVDPDRVFANAYLDSVLGP